MNIKKSFILLPVLLGLLVGCGNNPSSVEDVSSSDSSLEVSSSVASSSSEQSSIGVSEKTLTYTDTSETPFVSDMPITSDTVSTDEKTFTIGDITLGYKGVYHSGYDGKFYTMISNGGCIYNKTSLTNIKKISITFNEGSLSTKTVLYVNYGTEAMSDMTITGESLTPESGKTSVFEASSENNGFFNITSTVKKAQIASFIVTYMA